jgi:hypothetical protein
MLNSSIMAKITNAFGATSQEGSNEDWFSSVVATLMNADSDLNQSSAIRLANELLEMADPRGQASGHTRSFLDNFIMIPRERSVHEHASCLLCAEGMPEEQDPEF